MTGLLLIAWLMGLGTPAAPALPRGAAADTSSVTIALDRTSYAAGDTARVAVTNRTGKTALFALLCDAFVEGRSDSTWATVFEPDCSRVRVRPTRVADGETVVIPYLLDPGPRRQLARYTAFRIRLRFQLDGGGDDGVAHTAEFKMLTN
jgi:hypothetical protein